MHNKISKDKCIFTKYLVTNLKLNIFLLIMKITNLVSQIVFCVISIVNRVNILIYYCDQTKNDDTSMKIRCQNFLQLNVKACVSFLVLLN